MKNLVGWKQANTLSTNWFRITSFRLYLAPLKLTKLKPSSRVKWIWYSFLNLKVNCWNIALSKSLPPKEWSNEWAKILSLSFLSSAYLHFYMSNINKSNIQQVILRQIHLANTINQSCSYGLIHQIKGMHLEYPFYILEYQYNNLPLVYIDFSRLWFLNLTTMSQDLGRYRCPHLTQILFMN